MTCMQCRSLRSLYLAVGQRNQLAAPDHAGWQCQKGGVEIAFTGFVTERRTSDIQHFSTGAFEHTLCGSGVPLRGRRQARVAVGGTLGQQTELQGAADTDQDRKSTRLNSSHVKIS